MVQIHNKENTGYKHLQMKSRWTNTWRIESCFVQHNMRTCQPYFTSLRCAAQNHRIKSLAGLTISSKWPVALKVQSTTVNYTITTSMAKSRRKTAFVTVKTLNKITEQQNKTLLCDRRQVMYTTCSHL